MVSESVSVARLLVSGKEEQVLICQSPDQVEASDSWHSYPSIYAMGHKALGELLLDPVLVEEKVDGSQFSFGLFPDYPINGGFRARSKGAELNLLAPEKMSAKAVEVFTTSPLHPGWTYRAEYLMKPKHHTMAYDRVPLGHLAIFDINTGHERYLSYERKAEEAARLGLDVVPRIFSGMVTDAGQFRAWLETISFLGGGLIEGVVVKNYCVTPEHKTLTASLDWVPVGDLNVGDELVAFSDEGVGPLRSRYYQSSKVEQASRAIAEVLEIIFSDGSTLHCTENHPLLVHPCGKTQYVWREAGYLLGNESVSRFVRPWNRIDSYEAGYLAAIFDGEGHMLHRQRSLRSGVVEIGFSQNPGVVADTVLGYLNDMGFRWASSKPGNSSAGKYYLLGGKTAAMSFLGTTRPKRFLEKFSIDRLGGIKSRYTETLQIAAIRSIGLKEIVELQTSSGTYFTDGLASHNSRFGPDKKALMGKFVSERFKEVHKGEWRKENPTSKDIIDQLVKAYRSPARWQKAVQHLREAGRLEGSPRDIGALIKEVPMDIEKECMEEIKELLWAWAWPKVRRGITAGLAEWYKEELLAEQFSDKEDIICGMRMN